MTDWVASWSFFCLNTTQILSNIEQDCQVEPDEEE